MPLSTQVPCINGTAEFNRGVGEGVLKGEGEGGRSVVYWTGYVHFLRRILCFTPPLNTPGTVCKKYFFVIDVYSNLSVFTTAHEHFVQEAFTSRDKHTIDGKTSGSMFKLLSHTDDESSAEN